MPHRNFLSKALERVFSNRLQKCRRGATAVEFAVLLPVIMGVGMGGIELAWIYVCNLQVNALALAVSDNASRMEQTNNTSVTPTVTTNDIENVMKGALLEGAGINVQQKGKVILSSLERDPSSGKQYIHWQRCAGNLTAASAFGNQSDRNGLTGTPIVGMGSGATKVTAAAGSAVMFVEVVYRYEGMFGNLFTGPITMRSEGAYMIRDIRNLGTAGSNPITGTGTGWAC
ncbi:MAG: TadE/TadG family type IV pilus assembly protein [Novosphingobium sp.]